MSVLPVRPLVVRGLRVRFGPAIAVDGVDLEVGTGSVVALVGRNGGGKTSTLRAVLGLLRADDGVVHVDGFRAGSSAARSRIGYVPDEPVGLDELTIAEYGELVAALWHADAAYATRRDALLEVLGLAARARAPLGSLSHGQRRLVEIATAAALRPALLVVDEATAALDPEAVLALREIVRATAESGSGVLLATQDLHFAESACDRVVLLEAGRVITSGALDTVRTAYGAPTLERAFAAAVGTDERLQEVRRALGAR